jgi:hypothetical protein
VVRFTYLGAAFVALAAAALGLSVSWSEGVSYHLPYSSVSYDVKDAKRSFAGQGIKLIVGSRSPGVIDLHDARNVVEVTVFGDPDIVRKTGFQDLTHTADCAVAGHLALHWRANVRAIVNCDLVRTDARWIARMDRALATL